MKPHSTLEPSNAEDLVSVIIPAYQAEKFLPASVGSLFDQTHQNLDIIIVNDGSTDRTAEVAAELAAQDPRVQVISKTNGGLSSARNAGLRAVRGTYIGLLDADDIYLPEKLERQLAHLRAHPELDLVFSDHYNGDDELMPYETRVQGAPPLPYKEIYKYCNWFHPVDALYKTSLANKVGDFDESLAVAEDWDYWIRCVKAGGQFGYLPGALSVYRRHPNQLHHNVSKMRDYGFRVIAKNYGDTPRDHRIGRGALHFFYAKKARFVKNNLRMVDELSRLVLTVRNPAEIRRIVKILRHY